MSLILILLLWKIASCPFRFWQTFVSWERQVGMDSSNASREFDLAQQLTRESQQMDSEFSQRPDFFSQGLFFANGSPLLSIPSSQPRLLPAL